MVAFLGILVLTSCGNDGPDERGEGAVDQAEIMLGERVYPVMFALAILVVLAWKVAGRIGVDRWHLPALGTPWSPGLVIRHVIRQMRNGYRPEYPGAAGDSHSSTIDAAPWMLSRPLRTSS